MGSADDLQDNIVQPLVQLGRALLTYAQTHRDTSLVEHAGSPEYDVACACEAVPQVGRDWPGGHCTPRLRRVARAVSIAEECNRSANVRFRRD